METMRLYLVPTDFVDCPDCSPYRDDEELFNDEFHGRCLTCGYESDRLRAISEEADRLRKGE
jgi:hypothetical protein